MDDGAVQVPETGNVSYFMSKNRDCYLRNVITAKKDSQTDQILSGELQFSLHSGGSVTIHLRVLWQKRVEVKQSIP